MISRWMKVLGPHGSLRVHFSQFGEDTIIHNKLKKKKGFYMDVGAFHPFRKSNTAYLWCQGWNGVNVDANPESIRILKKIRKNDINIWGAVVSQEQAKTDKTTRLFFSKKLDVFASVSKELASEREMAESVEVPCVTLEEIVNEYAPDESGAFDFLNIDIEGLDYSAIAEISNWKTLPTFIAIETYMDNIAETLESNTSELLHEQGYTYVYQIGLTSIYKKTE